MKKNHYKVTIYHYADTIFICHQMAENKIDDISELMKLSSVGRNTINKLYREKSFKTVKLETFIKLCKAFNCSLSELIEFKPDKYEET